jgi:hypothetical protein
MLDNSIVDPKLVQARLSRTKLSGDVLELCEQRLDRLS